jgi:hypothetical protein
MTYKTPPATITINCHVLDVARIKAVLAEAADAGKISFPFEGRADVGTESQTFGLRYTREGSTLK